MAKPFVIATCVRCGRLLISRSEVKTRTCPHCNVRFALDKAAIVASLDSAQEAKQVLSDIKKRKAESD